MAKVVWTEPALSDLQSIIEFIAKDSHQYAERLGFHIVQAPQRLSVFPYSGRIVPELNDSSIRELIYSSYRIIHVIRPTASYIIAILHSSRDLLQHIVPGEWDVT